MTNDAPPTRATTSPTIHPPADGPSSASEVLQYALRTEVADLHGYEAGARRGSLEAVAQMRVTTRQLRCILLGFSGTLGLRDL